MIGILYYLTPIISIIFFVNLVSILKRIKNGQDTTNQTVWGSVMLGYITFAILSLISWK